jgi:acyl-CoA thioesterase-1
VLRGPSFDLLYGVAAEPVAERSQVKTVARRSPAASAAIPVEYFKKGMVYRLRSRHDPHHYYCARGPTLGAAIPAAPVAALLMAISIVACGSRDEARENTSAGAESARTTGTEARGKPLPRIVILGDSLTAGLGLPVDQTYPSLLQQRLKSEGLDYEVVNAGVSGDTSAGGLSRLDWALQGDVRILVVALGGNDGLRGLPPEALKRNLSEIIERAQARHVQVILAGMEAPPNYGRDYTVSFHRVYPALAEQYRIPLVPFLLWNVAGIDQLNQPDGIHPTAAGARIVADNVWRVLKPLAEEQKGEGRSGP